MTPSSLIFSVSVALQSQTPQRIRLAADVIAILDYEKLGKVHSVGHDTGSLFQSIMAPYYPDRFLSLAFLGVPYSPADGSQDMNVDAANSITKKLLGYEALGY
jgi:pimeloyl-ACP methyl ester carboxylesterase